LSSRQGYLLGVTMSGQSATESGLSVLVIEDNFDCRDSLSQLLDLWGYKVYSAADGREGVSLALRVSPDVVVSDIGLPNLDGHAVARRLRASLGDRVFLIALTAYDGVEQHEKAKAAGFDAHFTKPTDPEVLHNFLQIVSARIR
jgi:CheY-like chemotaxis protein